VCDDFDFKDNLNQICTATQISSSIKWRFSFQYHTTDKKNDAELEFLQHNLSKAVL
jgi:hypothetical protein